MQNLHHIELADRARALPNFMDTVYAFLDLSMELAPATWARTAAKAFD